MGRICICGSSAIEFWRLWRLFGHAVFRTWGLRPLPKFSRDWHSCIVAEVPPLFAPASQEDLEALTSPDDIFLSTPVDLFVSAAEKLGYSSLRATRPIPTDLPPGSLVQVCADLYVASPPYALVESTAASSRPESLRLIAEFCGSYALDPGRPAGFAEAVPLATISELRGYCRQARACKHVRGLRHMEANLAYAIEGCASPMEAVMVTLLCAPGREGGYGFRLPAMNLRTMGDARIMDRSHYKGDAVWEDAGVILEYDSKAFHNNRESDVHDNVRSMALELNGHRVMQVRTAMLMRPEVFHKVALGLGAYLGRRLRPERFTNAWWERCRNLRAEMLDYPTRWHRLMQAQKST